MMLVFSLLIAVLICWRGIAPLKIALKWKVAAGIFCSAVAFKFFILLIFSGKMFFVPPWPTWILLTSTWLYAWMVFFALFLIIYEVIMLIIKGIAAIRKKKLTIAPAWRISVPAISALISLIGMYGGLKIPAVVDYEIKHPDLPAELDGYTIAHLSDIHADPFCRREKIEKIVALTNALQTDLIVITGDFVDGKTGQRGKDLEVLRNLHAGDGVFGVPGNHEYYSGYAEWMNFLRSCGITMLENGHVLIGNNRITLAGVTDPAAGRMKEEKPDIVKALAGSPEDNFLILLAHQPRLADKAADAGVDLQLSGHTHGGMIWGMDQIVALFNKGLVSGTYDIGRMKLHISNGTGIWNGFPLRWGRPSEIIRLTLRCGTE